jgi:hypothetical protein
VTQRAAQGRDGPTRSGTERLAFGAWIALAALLHLRSIATGFVAEDLGAIAAVLRTRFDALLRPGTLPGDFAPLSRELWWWWWCRVVPMDALLLHAVSFLVAALAAWLLFRTAERWGGTRAGVIAGVVWTAFPPLGVLLAQASGARELVAVLAAAGAIAAFARGRWIAAGLACGAAALSGLETAVLPLVLLAIDVVERPADPPKARIRRLLPAFLLGVAATVWMVRMAPAVGKPAPAGANVVAWLIRAWIPAGSRSGLSILLHQAPWLVPVAAGLAILAVVGRRRGGGGGGGKAAEPSPMLVAGLATAALSLLPLALSPEPPRAERFALPAFGLALAAGTLARVRPWVARAVAAAVAVISLAANGVPLAGRGAPAFTSAAAVRDRAAALAPLMSALRPWCHDLSSVPRTFAAGVPPDSIVRLALDPGARVVCHDGDVSIRFLAEMTPADAARPFGVLRLDPSRLAFQFEPADAQVRARVGEGLLVFARPAPAAACFESALAERPGDRELIYPTVVALAAAQRTAEARARWEQAGRSGTAPSADTLAMRLLVGYRGPDVERVRQAIAGRAALVVADPTAAAPHLDLGRALLDLGRARSATLEISVACGIGRRSQDVFWLAQGYDAMGAHQEALEAYRATLAGGLGPAHYRIARQRLLQLLRELGTSAFGPASRP